MRTALQAVLIVLAAIGALSVVNLGRLWWMRRELRRHLRREEGFRGSRRA